MLLNHSLVAGGKYLIGPDVFIVKFRGITLELLLTFLGPAGYRR